MSGAAHDDSDAGLETRARGGAGWLWGAAVLDGVGTGVVNAALAVLVARRFGLAAAGVTIGIASAGRLLALAAVRFLETRVRSSAALRRAYGVLVSFMVMAALAALGCAWAAPYLAVVACSLTLTVVNNVTSVMLVSEGRRHVVRLGPLGIAGAAIGGALAGGSLALGGGIAVAGLATGACVQWLQVPMLARYGFAPLHHEPVAWRSLAHPGVRAAVASACCYGPLGIYAALVTDAASVAWVGPAMAAYALGALSAPYWDAHIAFGRRWPALCLWGAVGVVPWAFAMGGGAIVVGRALSGAALFLAQGRLLAQAAAEIPGAGGISATSTGLGLGAGIGTVLAGVLAAHWGVTGMGWALTGLTVAVAIGLGVRARAVAPGR